MVNPWPSTSPSATSPFSLSNSISNSNGRPSSSVTVILWKSRTPSPKGVVTSISLLPGIDIPAGRLPSHGQPAPDRLAAFHTQKDVLDRPDHEPRCHDGALHVVGSMTVAPVTVNPKSFGRQSRLDHFDRERETPLRT